MIVLLVYIDRYASNEIKTKKKYIYKGMYHYQKEGENSKLYINDRKLNTRLE